MTTDAPHRSADTLLRDTFDAAAERLDVGPPPRLDMVTHPATDDRRPRAGGWLAAAAAVALVVGMAWVVGSGDDPVPVSTTPSSIASAGPRPFHEFAEPTWIPDGLVLTDAAQDDRPMQYTVDVVTPDGEHATLHWTINADFDDPVWRDGAAPGGELAPTGVVDLPTDARTRPDLHAWGEATPGPATSRLPAPAAPDPASAITIRSLLRDLASQCATGPCNRYEPSDAGVSVLRFGPDGPSYAPTRLSYWGKGIGFLQVTTWPVTGAVPPADGTLPTPGFGTAGLDDVDFAVHDTTVDGRRALAIGGDVLVELPDAGLTVLVRSGASSIEGSEPSLPPVPEETLVRVAESLEVRTGPEFSSTYRRARTGLVDTVVASVDTGSMVFDVATYSPELVSECRLMATAREAAFGTPIFGIDACADPASYSGPRNGAAWMFGTMPRADAQRSVIGVFDATVARVRIGTSSGASIERATVPIPGSDATVIAVDIPAGGGTATLFDAAGGIVTTPEPLEYTADQVWHI